MNSNITVLKLHLKAFRSIRFAAAPLACFAVLFGLAISIRAQSLDVVLSTNLFEPSSIAIDASQNDFIADSANNRIVKFDNSTRAATSFAGFAGAANFGAVDGIGEGARFFDPEGIVTVTNGFVVADTGNHLIRFISFDGVVETLAGDLDLAQRSIDAGFPPDTYGFQDGIGPAAQFNSPTAVAWDGNDSIYIADSQNDAIRKLRLSDRMVTTVATGFSRPTGVAVGKNGRVYVSDTGNNAIKVIETNSVVTVLAGSNSRFASGYVDNADGARALFSEPRGLFFVESNFQLLVADSANRAIRRISDTRQTNPGVDTLVGPSGGLTSPVGLVRDDDGTILIADRGDNAVKAFRGAGLQLQVSPPQIGTLILTNSEVCKQINPSGTIFAVMSEVISNNIFNNDLTIAIQPEHAGAVDLGVQTFYTIGPTDPLNPIPDPTSSDSSPPKFFDCQIGLPESIISPIRPDTTIKAVSTRIDRRSSPVVTARIRFQVANPRVIGDSASAFSLSSTTTNAVIWYAFGLDEDAIPDPTNGAPFYRYTGTSINIANGTNNMYFKMRAYREGYAPSAVVTHPFVQTNTVFSTLGAPSDFQAGPGASIVVPVEVMLAPNVQLGSFQFRADVSPLSASETPEISFVTVPPNDFVMVEDPVFNPLQAPIPQPILAPPQAVVSFQEGTTNGVGVAYFGVSRLFPLPRLPKILVTNQIQTVSLLRVDVPATAHHGDQFRISFVNVSGTIDGDQEQIAMVPMPDRTITVSTNLLYIVGDSARGAGYNAGQFGDRNLRNDDGNNAFDADFGLRVPLHFTDAFDAMDAFPVDQPGKAGGDGIIRYLDWQTILARSLQLDENVWARRWVEGGVRLPFTTNLNGSPLVSAESLATDPQATNIIWRRAALLRAGNANNAVQAGSAEIPITLELRPGVRVSGMQFAAYVKPVGDQVPITNGISFFTSTGIPQPSRREQNGSDGIICAWNYDDFNPPLSGTNLIGKLVFQVPSESLSNQRYDISFAYPDGSLGLETQIDFESIRGSVWVGVGSSIPIERISDEWKLFFFQDLANPLGADDLDPDHDGASNYIEYLDGTNPRASDFTLNGISAAGDVLKFRWFASTGVHYALEANLDLSSTNWSVILPPVTGAGQLQSISYTNTAHLPSQSFRLRVNP